jgi:DHA2 family multidrug resistance protein
MYYVPITGLAMGSVDEREMASAAGLMNFVRTIAGAFATSLVTTFWQDGRYTAHDQLSGIVDPTGDAARLIDGAAGATGQMARELFDTMVTGQSMQLATNGLMLAIAILFFISAFTIALAPKPSRTVDAASVGH